MNQHRKIILVAVFGVMLLLWAGDWLLQTALRVPMETRRAKAARLRTQIQNKEKEFAQFRQDGKQLEIWEQQSLPSNVEVARSLYQAWLLELANHVGLAGTNVDSSEPANAKGMYHVLSFSMRGRGTLSQLTKFLFEFYRCGQLHQLRSLQIAPVPRGELLELSFSIEALALPDLKRTNRLGGEPSPRQAADTLQRYQAITARNIFATGGPAADATMQTRLTAVIRTDGRSVAWFSSDQAREIIKLGEGESLQVGPLSAKIVEVYDTDVVLDIDGQKWLLTIGDSIAQAAALPPEL